MKLRAFVLMAVVAVSVVGLGLVADGARDAKKADSSPDSTTKGTSKAEVKKLRDQNASLRRKLKSLAPRGVYIVVDTASNVLYLKKGDSTLRAAVVSSGSGNVLEEPGGKRRWVFDTPRGEFSVTAKLEDPDWVRPDWAFIEEGKDIPSRWSDRVESGVLGDYALGFGDGYFIHGTLYTRLLGRNVTHGCIRLGDEDLKVIYRSARVGTPVFIF